MTVFEYLDMRNQWEDALYNLPKPIRIDGTIDNVKKFTNHSNEIVRELSNQIVRKYNETSNLSSVCGEGV